MPRRYKRKAGARKYLDYESTVLRNAVNSVRSKELSQRKAAAVYNVPLSTLKLKLKQPHSPTKGKPGHPTIFTPDEEQSFCNCIIKLSQYGFPVDAYDLRMFVVYHTDFDIVDG